MKILKKNEGLINDIENTLRSKSTRNIKSFKKNSVLFKDELLNNLFDSQTYNDTYVCLYACMYVYNTYVCM